MIYTRLTTIDNPYNPFDQFLEWYLYDLEKGYNTSELLGRIVRTSDAFTDEENEIENRKAIDSIIQHDLTKKYIKVTKNY